MPITDAEIERLQTTLAEHRERGHSTTHDWSIKEVTDTETVVTPAGSPSKAPCYHKNHDGEPACQLNRQQSIDWRTIPRDSSLGTARRACLRCYPDGDSHGDADE